MRPVPDHQAHRVRLPRRAGGQHRRRHRRAVAARDKGEALSIGLLGNAADLFPHLLNHHAPIDIVTDQTSAHDPLTYLPRGVAFEDMAALRAEDPAGFTRRARESMAAQVAAMVGFLDAGAEVFDYGNSIRGEAQLAGYQRAFDFPGFVPAYIRPLFCEGKGPFRWAALSGDPADIAATDQAILDLFPQNEALARWIRMAEEKVHFQGLPARICWLGYGERHLAGLRFNEMVKSGEVKAPIVLGRDHLDCGSVASPYRETEAMADGSDAIADWPLLNALVNTASGASWVSIHHGGGVGIGRSIHAGQVCVADGSDLAAQKLERVLVNDPGMGVIRHTDAGYDLAATVAPSAASASRWPAREQCQPGGSAPLSPPSFADLWRDLEPLGRDPVTGGYRRYSWTAADAACRAWFTRQAEQRGLDVETDNNGNLWAWWGPKPGAVVTGSHLDSVPDGGGFDGALGVVTALAAVDLLQEKNFNAERPVVLAAFTEEEGARFGLPCLGSRLLTGAVDPDAARALADEAGTTLAEAMTAAGHDPGRLGPAPPCWTASAPSSNCTSSRAAPSRRWGRPSDSPRASGRTAGGGWTSPARPTTRARPGSPTAGTRCSPTRARSSRPATPRPTMARWPRSARSSRNRTAPTRSARPSEPGWTPGPRTKPHCGRLSPWSVRPQKNRARTTASR